MSEHEHKHEVKIFIDQQAHHSPNPTTGVALYTLGNVKPGMELFREVAGDREDPEVDNGPEVIHLKQDEHFHSGPPKVYHIIVNGRRKEVSTKTLTFNQVVALAFNPVPSGPNVQFSVTYRKGPKKNAEGTMTEGETVRIKDGMIFDVTETNNRSADLTRLRNEGYDLEIRSDHLLVKDVPYVAAGRIVKRGILVMPLKLAGDVTVKPENHVTHFIGEFPRRADDTLIDTIGNVSNAHTKLGEGVEIDQTFSAKPMPTGFYENYYDKVTQYATILSGYAQKIEPGVTAKTFRPVVAAGDEDTVFKYIDTASTRAEIGAITAKLAKVNKIAIVGLGGTGSYVLDLVAKTPVREIHLFDGDDFLQHNAFRSPGAPSLDELVAMPKKAAYLKSIYDKMRNGIFVHENYISADNVDALRQMSFVFLCMEGTAKKFIVEKLEEFGLPFIDVGMGVYLGEGSLGGILRVTTSTPVQRDHLRKRVSFASDADSNEYATNIQIADLNALNAALALIKWKKLAGFYQDLDFEHNCTYTIGGNMVRNEDVSTPAAGQAGSGHP